MALRALRLCVESSLVPATPGCVSSVFHLCFICGRLVPRRLAPAWNLPVQVKVYGRMIRNSLRMPKSADWLKDFNLCDSNVSRI